MAKNLKLNIKNAQIAQAINLNKVKSKLAAKKDETQTDSSLIEDNPSLAHGKSQEDDKKEPQETPRVKARSKSAFAEPPPADVKPKTEHKKTAEETPQEEIPATYDKKPDVTTTTQAHPAKTSKDEEHDSKITKEEAPQKQEKQPHLHTETKVSEEPARPAIKESQLPPSPPRETPTYQQQLHFKQHTSQHHEPQQREKQHDYSSRPHRDSSHRESFHRNNSQRDGSQRESFHRDRDSSHRDASQRFNRPSNAPGRHQDFPPRQHGPQEPRPPRSWPPTDTKKPPHSFPPPREKLGPTGKHINDLLPPKMHKNKKMDSFDSQLSLVKDKRADIKTPADLAKDKEKEKDKFRPKNKPKSFDLSSEVEGIEDSIKKGGVKSSKLKEFKDLKPAKRTDSQKNFDVKSGKALLDDDAPQWRKKKHRPQIRQEEDLTIRPTSLTIRTPISIKDLAAEMKLKASQLIGKLFMQGVVLTLNDLLDDETTIQLLGQEFGCEITIDTTEEKRIRITDKSIKEEISESPNEQLEMRAPIVAFMGHVDHGKTSLIDTIRQSNRAAGEAGAITQHMGAFRCHTPVGDIAILDTPGHEAFSAMRARGADVTDIVVLVIAGDEGIRAQTDEAIQHAKAAQVTIVVALNKCDKPNFNAENVYRQLSERELLPEQWGGQTIVVNCSAVTGQGIPELLEMLALQAEVLELKANPHSRARGTVLESELNKGLGAVATVLVQNGTLKLNDALVFGHHWGRVKTIRNEFAKSLTSAGPSTPVEITGISGLPEAGNEFIVVRSEKEARDIAAARSQDIRQFKMQQTKKLSMENLFQQAQDGQKKILNLILRADVQGSMEALRTALLKIKSNKVDLNIIFAGVGEISEADVQLAAASKAVILGFHTAIESHADMLVKEMGIQVKLHDIIYHAIDDIKAAMTGILDRIAKEEDRGVIEVKAIFKSSHYGIIAGCQVAEGFVHRNHHIRIKRNSEIIWKGSITSLKRLKDDVREVQKGLECGIVLNGFQNIQEGDILESYDITYITQEL